MGDVMISTTKLLDIINKDTTLSIQELLQQVPGISFQEYFLTLAKKKGMTKSEVINKTTLQRNYAYQIFDGTKNPSKDKVLQLSFALHLGLRETNNLLSLSNNGALYPKVKRDALFIFSLKQKIDVIKVNELLDEFSLDILE